MLLIPRSFGLMVVILAASLHYAWAGIVTYDNVASWATSVAPIWHWFGQHTAVVLASFSTAALLSLCAGNWIVRIFMLVPQQFITLLSAGGVIVAVYNGQYADGVDHPRSFIATDQIIYVLLSILHAVSMVRLSINGKTLH
jgi:hypothetical protein